MSLADALESADAKADELESLRQALRAVCESVTRTGKSRCVALRWPLTSFPRLPREAGEPSPLLSAFGAAAEDRTRFYWERVSEGRAMLGTGVARRIECTGPQRFERAAAAVRALFEELDVLGEAPVGVGPLLLGGFAFGHEAPSAACDAAPSARRDEAPSAGSDWQGFAPASLVLPELLVVDRSGLNTAACSVHEIAPGSDADALVDATLASLRELLAAALHPAPPEISALTDGAVHSEFAAPSFRALSDRSHEGFCGTVADALRAIDDGAFEKVVLARSLELRAEGGARFDACALLESLRRAHPRCVSFAIERGEKIFVGATPERLVHVDGDVVRATAVAGSASRGESPQEDERRARALRESRKEQAEHAVVVRAIEEALAPLCAETERADAPRVLQLEGIQHLETPIRAHLTQDARQTRTAILELLARLHPTPAVGGAPREPALAWLEAHEGLDRGWYAGPIGFMDAQGGGEFYVALRSALLGPARARLFAGAGIVAGSRPEAELAETRLKLRTLLAPLLEV